MNYKDLNYSFTPVPTTFLYLMDSDCYKAMSLLMQEESYWKTKERLSHGYFYKSMEEIKNVLSMKNEKDARLTIEALYRRQLIDVLATDGKRQPLKIKLNWSKINEYATMSITDILKFETPIAKLKRDETLTYCQHLVEVTDENEAHLDTICTPTINNIENKENIDKEKIEKESSYSLSSSNNTKVVQVLKPYKSEANTETQEQATTDTNDKQDVIGAIRHNLLTIVYEEMSNGETICEEDALFQETLRLIMFYYGCEKRQALVHFNRLIPGYRKGVSEHIGKENSQVSC